MDQGDLMSVKALKERFQNHELSNVRIKPVIPEKPKTIPPISPTSKISNPLIASINSAVESGLAPRVVFKDDQKNPQPPQQPQTSLIKAKPIFLDKNQKKEADLIKQALKDKKTLPMSPVSPVLQQPPKPESTPKSPILESPFKVSSPMKKTIFNKTDNNEKQKSNHSEWDVPASPVFKYSDSSISTLAQAEATANKPVDLNAHVPPVKANPTVSAPVISPHVFPVSNPPPAVTVLNPIYQNGPQKNNPKQELPVSFNPNVSPTADVFLHGLPEEETTDPKFPDTFDMDIPPPIIPEDFADGGTSVLDTPISPTPEYSIPRGSVFVPPISSNPALPHTHSLIPESQNPNSDSDVMANPLSASLAPLTNIKPMAENKVPESHSVIDHINKPLDDELSSSPKSSVVSALARAEEMAPAKHNNCDKRLLNLLEKSKRKSTGSHSSTSEILPVFETDLPSYAPVEPSPPDIAAAEPFAQVDTPNNPETTVTFPDIPAVDYGSNAQVTASTENYTNPAEKAFTDHEQRKSSPTPKLVTVQKPLVPPQPPPRKPQLSVSNDVLIPEKPHQLPSTDKESTILPDQLLEYNGVIIPAPAGFSFDDSAHENSAVWNPSEVAGLQVEAPDYGTPGPPVHEKASLEPQPPTVDTTDIGLPQTVAVEQHPAPVPDSLFNTNLPSPSGKSIHFNSTELEDLSTSKKSKAPKKHRKGSPLNPYADTPAVIMEDPKIALPTKRNSLEEKEAKSKDKQKQKDKDKEKEKEKKEPKEKEKEKEQKDKKEQKEKKKELKDKERDKKELKEKEREKREQKEKEKKENEMKKKFKITGEVETIYEAKVTETIKGRKDDLAIKAGDIISIIRTTDCPKGKWLAKDSTSKYGYIPVESVELDIEEVIALGKKTKASKKNPINGIIDPMASAIDIRSSHPNNQNQYSFDDDSEEWGDDDDTVFPPTDTTDQELNHRVATTDFGPGPVPALAINTDKSNNVHSGQEALHKLTTFFSQPKTPTLQNNTPIQEPPVINAEEPVSQPKQEPDLQILPPPDLYADIVG